MSVPLPKQISIVGVGYVGLPLATAFGRIAQTVGFDEHASRVAELKNGFDRNGHVSSKDLLRTGLRFTTVEKDLEGTDFFVVTVLATVNSAKRPDLGPLPESTRTAGHAIRATAESKVSDNLPPVVVCESTVYPGCTEDICVPLLEEMTGG